MEIEIWDELSKIDMTFLYFIMFSVNFKDFERVSSFITQAFTSVTLNMYMYILWVRDKVNLYLSCLWSCTEAVIRMCAGLPAKISQPWIVTGSLQGDNCLAYKHIYLANQITSAAGLCALKIKPFPWRQVSERVVDGTYSQRSSGEKIRRGETLAKFPFQFPIEVSCLRNQSWIGLGRIALGCRVVDQYQSTPCACSSRHFSRRRCQKNICWLAYGIWGNGVCIGNWSKCRFITLKLK